jgi:hypothetical protein
LLQQAMERGFTRHSDFPRLMCRASLRPKMGQVKDLGVVEGPVNGKR